MKLVKLQFNTHPKGIRTSYTGTDPYLPKNTEGQPVTVQFFPGEEEFVSEEKSKQLLKDYPYNFKKVAEADTDTETGAIPTKEKTPPKTKVFDPGVKKS